MNRNKVIRILEKCAKEPLRRNADKYVVTLDVRFVNSILELLKEQEGYVSVPFSWLVKFCTHIDFNEPMWDEDREKLWKQKLKQQFDIDTP